MVDQESLMGRLAEVLDKDERIQAVGLSQVLLFDEETGGIEKKWYEITARIWCDKIKEPLILQLKWSDIGEAYHKAIVDVLLFMGDGAEELRLEERAMNG